MCHVTTVGQGLLLPPGIHSPLLPSRSPAPLAIQCPDRTALIALRAGEWAVSSGQDKSVKAPEIYKKNKKINGGCYATACLLHILILPHEHDDGGWCPSAANHLVLFSRALPLLPRLLRLLIMACPVPCTLRYTAQTPVCCLQLHAEGQSQAALAATCRAQAVGLLKRARGALGALGLAHARFMRIQRDAGRAGEVGGVVALGAFRCAGRMLCGRFLFHHPANPLFPVPASSPSSWEPPAV